MRVAQGDAYPLDKCLHKVCVCVSQADAYQVLGVAPDVSASDIKRRYMQLSLQIHLDKCLHKVRVHECIRA